MQEGVYLIILAAPGVERDTIDLPSEGAHLESGTVQKMRPNESRFQQWVFMQAPDRLNRWKIRCNVTQEKYLQVDSDEPGTPIRFCKQSDSPYQIWSLDPQGDNTYTIVNDGSGLCVDWNSEHPMQLQQNHVYGNQWQRWKLQKP